MAHRINNLIACLVGCVIAALSGLLLMLKFDSAALAMLTAGIVPPLACWISGITDKKQLGKIAVYAGIGWLLGFMLQPAIAETSASHTRRILSLPLLGYDWHVHGSVVSTLLALVGVYFIPDEQNSNSVENNATGDNRQNSTDVVG